MLRKPILAAIILSGLSACYTPVGNPVLPLPPPLVLPVIQEAELQCLPDDAYLRLAESYTMLKARVKTLEAIIRSTHVKPGRGNVGP